jgi:TolA-binding protein
MASARFHAGESFFRLGRHEDAVKHLTHLVDDFADSKEHGPALLRLGESLANLQHWARSERVFTEYLSGYGSSEHWYQAQFGVGWARENQKRYDEAIDAYRKVTSRHQGPKTARAQFQIGECLFAKKRYDEAVRELLKVDILYAYPEWSAAALYEAARCFEKLGKVVEARAHFKLVVDQHKQTRWAQLATQRLTEIASTGLPGR